MNIVIKTKGLYWNIFVLGTYYTNKYSQLIDLYDILFSIKFGFEK